MAEYPVEDDVTVLKTTAAQPEAEKTETNTNTWRRLPCNDGMDTTKHALSEVLLGSNGTVNEHLLTTRDLLTAQTIDPFCRKVGTSVGKL